MMVLELQQWFNVYDVGFMKYNAFVAQNYDIVCKKYYRSLLDPAYEKIKVAFKEKLVQSEAENVSVCLKA